MKKIMKFFLKLVEVVIDTLNFLQLQTPSTLLASMEVREEIVLIRHWQARKE